jgi:hypothetical protein
LPFHLYASPDLSAQLQSRAKIPMGELDTTANLGLGTILALAPPKGEVWNQW